MLITARRSRERPTAVLGIDGCRRGWIGVVLDDGDPIRAVGGRRLAEVIEAAGEVEVVAADMPVGMSDSGTRQADVAARAILGRRWASIFLSPVLQAAAASDYEQANTVNRAITGHGLSRQAWALVGKIAEVEAWREATGQQVWEVHPEVAFVTLAGRALCWSKKTWAGAAERRQLLASASVCVPDDLGAPGSLAAVDDVLDAAVVAWSASRIARGTARCWPDPPEVDRHGRAMAIWA